MFNKVIQKILGFLILFRWKQNALPSLEIVRPDDDDFITSIAEPGTSTDRGTPEDRAEAAAGRGEFYFKERILDKLDNYFFYIRRMRAVDPDAFALYSQLGCHICPERGAAIKNDTGARAYLKGHRPGFGAVAFMGADADEYDDYLKAQFLYFTKFEKKTLKGTVERPRNDDDIYIVTVFLDRKNIKYGHALEFAVAVDRAANVRPLRTLCCSRQTIRSKRKGGAFSIPQKRWMIHPMWQEVAREKGETVQEYLIKNFEIAFSAFVLASSAMVRIEVEDHAKLRASFGVDIKRMPYFFKDRKINTNKKKKIFHIVRAHLRATKNGETPIRLHFRGARQFEWNKYKINISVPGKHHAMFADFDLPTHLLDETNPISRNMIGMKGVGKILHDHVRGGPMRAANNV